MINAPGPAAVPPRCAPGAGPCGGRGRPRPRASGRRDPAGTDATPRDGGRRAWGGPGLRGGRGAAQLRHPPGPPHGPRGRAHGGDGGHQPGLRGGPATLLAPGPQERPSPLPTIPGQLLPASASHLPAGAGAGAIPPRPPALHHLRRAAEHRAVAHQPRAAPAQGLPGGVGAGDHLLLPADGGHRPRLLPRDPGCAQPRGHGPGDRGIQKGPVAGPLQPPLWVVRLHQLGHLRPRSPVSMTGPRAPGTRRVPGAPRSSPRAGGAATDPMWHRRGCRG